MQPLKSPWINQLDRTRPLYTLQTDVETDICIVGGGVSGVMTAYRILKHTNHKVAIIEASEIAHGATGHNAGQLVDELERSTVSLVEEYGLEKVADALQSVKSAWMLLEEVVHDAELTVPYSTFEGYDVFSTKEQIHDKLADMSLADEGGINLKKMYISREYIHDLKIDSQYSDYYELIAHDSILSLAETKNPEYIAAYPLRKGCLNSAVLTEQLTTYLQSTYGIKRFQVFEKSPVDKVILNTDSAHIHTEFGKIVAAHKVILCTNGFEHFDIVDNNTNINYDFHKHVKGNIGYMLGITEEINHTPSAFAYLDSKYKKDPEALRDIAYAPEYVYTTRRPYDLGHEEPKNLFCLGGKGTIIEDTSRYGKDHTYHPNIKAEYDAFINKNFSARPIEPDHKEFMWHGLMGYTQNGLRMVGFEKRHPVLMYNLGCNGIGILPAIWGAKRIADLLNGDTSVSLFDPGYSSSK